MKQDIKTTRVTLEEAFKLHGKTQWARLIAEERRFNKKAQPARTVHG